MDDHLGNWESHCDRILTISKLKLHKSLEDIPKNLCVQSLYETLAL